MGKNIVLIGFMGTGKSAVGVKLAEKLNREFVDMDREIEKVTGLTISQIFRRYGEVRFRSEEKLMAQKLGKRSNLVIATGGGSVLDEKNIKVLQENGVLICLESDPEEILERVNRKKGTRPLLKKDTTTEDIKEMLQQREKFYSCAKNRVNTVGKNLDQIVHEIIDDIKKDM